MTVTTDIKVGDKVKVKGAGLIFPELQGKVLTVMSAFYDSRLFGARKFRLRLGDKVDEEILGDKVIYHLFDYEIEKA